MKQNNYAYLFYLSLVCMIQSVPCFAHKDGELGRTSTGSVEVELKVLPSVQIYGLSDPVFQDFSAGMEGTQYSSTVDFKVFQMKDPRFA